MSKPIDLSPPPVDPTDVDAMLTWLDDHNFSVGLGTVISSGPRRPYVWVRTWRNNGTTVADREFQKPTLRECFAAAVQWAQGVRS